MKKPTLLYVEEVRNSLSEKVVTRRDINLVLLRFKQNLAFDNEYLARTSNIPCFVYNKSKSTKSEVGRFKKFCSKNRITIDRFYNDSEYHQELVQEFANLLGIPGSLTKKQALCVRDKAAMKDMLQDIGYRTMNYSELSSVDDVIEFVKKSGDYPIIVKWRKGLSSKEVYKIENKKQLLDLHLDFSAKRYIAEEYCPYRIWCIDSLIQNGKVVATFYAWLPYTNLSFTEKKDKFAQITVPSKPKWFTFDGSKITQNIINELNLTDGYMHLEAFVDDFGQPTICEFAWRTPGEHMLLNHSLAFDIDVYSLLIDIMIGKSIEPLKIIGKKSVGDMFLPIYDGIITKISSYNDLSKVQGVIDGNITYKEGDIAESKRQYTNCSGWIQINGKDEHQVLERMLSVYKSFTIKTRKGPVK